MNQHEFEHWSAVTAGSTHRWVEDEIRRLNGHGLFYYTGGEDGVYVEISEDGHLDLGTYEGAIPHIGEAFFTPKTGKQCADKNEAFQLACQLGGRRFLIDLCSGDGIPQYDDRQGIRQSGMSME